MNETNRVVIETGKKKVFASAIDWPGWSRSAKSEGDALDVLARYAERYAPVVAIAGLAMIPESFNVVDRVQGSGVTDFGVPDVASEIEYEPMSDETCERQIAILRACWTYFDTVADTVTEELRKGPRGGGRDRTKIVEHVFDAERNYVRKIGVRTPAGAMYTDEGLREHRDAVSDAIRTLNVSGEDLGKWPLRYFIRRAAWHVLDHAWEMQDKDLTER